jgi:hypothetical protein
VSLRHTFVLAGVPAATAAGGDVQPSTAAPAPQLYVVDPCFRDSFQLPNATPAYAAMWEALPALFVGTAAQLVPLVEVMCEQVRSCGGPLVRVCDGVACILGVPTPQRAPLV